MQSVNGFVVNSKSIKFLVQFYNLFGFAILLKLNSLFKLNTLIDLFAIDLFNFSPRFSVIYSFWNYQYGTRIFVEIFLKNKFYALSLKRIFRSTQWLEREIWDMYGIKFLFHGDLRRILTDYSFEGYPLCKNFLL